MSARAARQASPSPRRGRSSRGSPGPKSATSRGSPGPKSATSRKSSGKKSKSPGSRATSARSKSPPKSRMSSAKTTDSMMSGGKSSSITSRRVRIKSADLEQKGLRAIDMSGQGMTAIGGTLFNRKDVGELDLSSNNIRTIPPDIKKLSTLVHIDLSRNGIRCAHPQDFSGLPKEIASMPNLEILLLSECNLPFVPPAIWLCRNLKVLDISRNKINMLVPDIGNMERLQHLNAQQTSIITLPPEIALCQDLEEVMLWGNVIESLPETLRELPKLKVLAINFRSFCNLVDAYREGLLKKGQIQSEHIPPVLFEMPALDGLDLTETKLNMLPDECAGKLKEFSLAQNFFKEIPKMIVQMTTLENLDLSNNMIKSIPDQMGSLINLQQLKLSNNKITMFPASIGKLVKLESLIMDGNQINAFPADIGNLRNLRTLVFNQNNLRNIPETIIELEQLETLDLTENKITSLPLNFYKMKMLKSAHMYQKFHKYGLWLHLNPLTTPPQEVWQTEDPQRIYDYLKRLQIQRTENLQRQKLYVLGESQCGKTSLVRSMTTGKSALTNGIADSTEMISFSSWKTDNGVDFLINDFGGADVYKNTHHLFLDRKGIYMLVYDHTRYTPERHNEAIGCWLEMLDIYVPGAVVKIIGTQDDLGYVETTDNIHRQVEEKLREQQEAREKKLDAVMSGLDQTMKERNGAMTKQEYDHLLQQKAKTAALKKQPLRIQTEVAVVSSAVGIKGILGLVNELEMLAVDKTLFAEAQRFIPESWFKYRLILKKHKDYCLTLDFCRKKGKDHGMKKEEVVDCLQFLSDSGEILWFQQNDALKNVIFQRPFHLVDILRGIFRHDMEQFLDFDTNRIFACKGQFLPEMFQEAKDRLRLCGQVSRPLLKCMWFYLLLSNNDFHYLLNLLPHLDLCYTIPQPEFPSPRHVFTPLMVIPSFSVEPNPSSEEINEIWPYPLPPGQCELTITTTFPFMYPRGIFEKLTCRIQGKISTRLDWQNIVYAELETGAVFLERKMSENCTIAIKARGMDLKNSKDILGAVAKELLALVSAYHGLIWQCECSYDNCDEVTAKDCFPSLSLVTG